MDVDAISKAEPLGENNATPADIMDQPPAPVNSIHEAKTVHLSPLTSPDSTAVQALEMLQAPVLAASLAQTSEPVASAPESVAAAVPISPMPEPETIASCKTGPEAGSHSGASVLAPITAETAPEAISATSASTMPVSAPSPTAISMVMAANSMRDTESAVDPSLLPPQTDSDLHLEIMQTVSQATSMPVTIDTNHPPASIR